MKKSVFKKLFLICLAIILLIRAYGTSYSWFSTKSSKVNAVDGANLKTDILEDFISLNNWLPDKNHVKSIKIINTGNCDAIVRVSISEILFNFQKDNASSYDSGNLKAAGLTGGETIIDLNDPSSYENASYGNVVKASKFDNGTYSYELYNIIESVYKSTNTMMGKDENRDLNISSKIQLIWNASLGVDWIYEDGYFYYTKVLKPGFETTPLLDAIRLIKLYNDDKGMVYKMAVNHDSITTSKDGLVALSVGGWALSEGSSLVLPILKNLMSR